MNKYIKDLLLLLCVGFVLTARGQNTRQERRIYLVDVTASMSGKGAVETPDIFNKVKESLANAIQSIKDPNTEVVIIPFTNTPHGVIAAPIKDKESLLTYMKNLSIGSGDTNIADAWSRGIEEIDSTRINYIFLLTDGLHNCGPTTEVLYERLKAWEDFARGKYYFAFYVMLTPEAKEQEICDIVDQTDQMWLIESMDVQVTFINFSMNMKANVKAHKTLKVPFTTNNVDALKQGFNFRFKLEDNPYYKLSNFKITYGTDGGYAIFDIAELKPIVEIPLEVPLNLHIEYDRANYPMIFFTPEDVRFSIVNRGIREMTIKAK